MKYILMLVVLFSTLCYAEPDSVLAQKGTQLNTGYDVFKTSEGGELRVVHFNKPSIHHFFTFANNQIFMNSVADKQKNLREVRFIHNQYELAPYTATADTPLQWTMDMVKAVQAKSQTALNSTPLEARSSRLLIENLSRGCGDVQVLGELSDDKTAFARYVVKVDGIGELHSTDTIEGVSCDNQTLMVATVSCYGEKGPCYQQLSSVQFNTDELIPSDYALLKGVYGDIDDSGAILNLPEGSAPIYAFVLLSRYVEINNRALLYVITKESESNNKNYYCSYCSTAIKVSFFERLNDRWKTIGTQVEQYITGTPFGIYYLENIGDNDIALVYNENNSRGGEGYFDFEIYKITPSETSEVLKRHHFYEYNSFCPTTKSDYSTIEFIKSSGIYDVKLKLGHYNSAECKKIKYINEEQLYRFVEGEYKLITEKSH